MFLRPTFLRLLSAIGIASALVATTRGSTPGLPGDSIMVGTVYNIFHDEFPTDADFFRQVDRDIPAIAAAGFDTVMIFPLSEWDPATHALRWTRTDYLIRKIEAAHLKFVPLMLKEEQCSYYFPIWKFQELGMWNERNLDNGNPNNRENVDFADARVLPMVDEYFKAVATRYKGSPALSFYNVWNEPHYSSTAPHVVARFREWLQRKYGSLAALRRAWGDDDSDWDEVSPFLNDDWNSSMPQIDWALFRNELDGALLDQLVAMLRRYDPDHPVNANPVGTPFGNFAPPGGYNIDNWQVTRGNDFCGASYYPDAWAREHGLARAPLWHHDLNFTVFRSAAGAKDYILTELYTNAKSGLTLGGYLDAATAREVAWTALANDCKGLIYWKWDPFRRGRQSLGRGLVDLNGRLAPRGEAVSAFARVAHRHGPLLREARLLPAQVALVVDMVGLLKTVQQPAEPRTQKFMYESVAGVLRALDGANLTVDLLRSDLGLDLDRLKRYRALVLPFQIVVRREFAATLRAYVEAGGHVLADARTGTLDELDFAYAPSPGAGLIDLFGADRKDWIATPEFHRVHLSGELGTGDFDAKYFREELEPQPGTTVLATYPDSGAPAIVSHRVGSGLAVLSAVPLGASYYDRPTPTLQSLLVKFCTDAGVTAPAKFVSPDGALQPMLRVHAAGPGERVVYAINETDATATGDLQLAPGGDASSANAACRVTDLLTDTPVEARLAGGVVHASVPIPAQGVVVLHVLVR